jgi:hypothetical protein
LEALDLLPSGETTTLVLSPLPGRPSSGHASEQAEGSFASSWPEKEAIDTSVLDAISRDLAYHVGPIAKVIVSRAAKRATTLDDLFALVAAEISTEKKRQDFMATRIKHSLSKS